MPEQSSGTSIAVACLPRDWELEKQLLEADARLQDLMRENNAADPAWRLMIAIRVLIKWPDASFRLYYDAMASLTYEFAEEPKLEPELYEAAIASWNEVCVAILCWDPLECLKEIVFRIEGSVEG